MYIERRLRSQNVPPLSQLRLCCSIVLGYKLLCLPLLPPENINPEFKKISIIARLNHRSMFESYLKYYERQWMVKEGPSKISVFKLYTRTTGALEAYNGSLGRKIISKGHFFKFVKVLLDEDYRKSKSFATLLKGRDDKRVNKGDKYQVFLC